jgi:hypothetical protein
MGNPRWLKNIYFHMVDDLDSKRLKVAALTLLHPTTSPLFRKGVFFILQHSPKGEKEGVRGISIKRR